MSQRDGHIHFGLWLTYLEGLGGWRLPDSRVEEVNTAAPYIELAQLAERAKLDAVIRGDGVSFVPEHARRHPAGGLEILTLLAALATHTTHVGLIGTASTTFSDPYNLSRQLASIDHLSKGRFGWNIVTSSAGERNFGYETIPDQVERYARADEFIDVATALWGSWHPGAIKLDRENGVYADPELIKPIHHHGTHFDVEGPLNVPPSPQGRPVLIQAGSSGPGREFAAKNAEIIFTASQTIENSREFYTDMKKRIRENGRNADQVKILPGLSLFLAESNEAAQQAYQERLDLIDIEEGREGLEKALGEVDLSGLELDEEIPLDRLPDTTTLVRRQSRPQIFVDLAVTQHYTLRQVIHAYVTTNGHGQIVGGPQEVIEHIIERFEEGVADGFVLFPGLGLRSVRVFVDKVIPELRRRGYVRDEYEGTTLRDHFGLPPLESSARVSSSPLVELDAVRSTDSTPVPSN